MTTRVSDIIVPELFGPYVQQETEQKIAIVNSGAATRDPILDQRLAEGGITFNEPSFQDLADDDDNVASDDPNTNSTPKKIQTSQEVQVRMSRNQSWQSMDLAGDLAGSDPVAAIGNRVSNYWARRSQAAFVATMKGVFANNALASPSGTADQDDMTFSVSENGATAGNFAEGGTNVTAGAFLDATLTMGDSMEDLSMIQVHSVVYNRMQKLNLIEFVVPAEGSVRIPTYLNRRVVVDDSMPADGSGVFETWLFGTGALRLGLGSPKVPSEVDRDPDAGNGSGAEILFSRTEWVLAPVGYAYAGTPPNGGPSNAATANNLANAGSWSRVWPERKQIKIARLVTREF